MEIVSSIEQQTQRLLPGMFLAMIQTELGALCNRERPGKAVSKDTGFESAVPQDRTGWPGKMAEVGKFCGLFPNAPGPRDLVLSEERS